MHQETLKEIVVELEGLLTGRFLGRIYQLSDQSLAVDFGLKQDGYLFISVDPETPRLHLIKRGHRDLEKKSRPAGPFAQVMRSTLSGGSVVSISKDEQERVVRLAMNVTNELSGPKSYVLVVQLTGRSTNLFLLDAVGIIIHSHREMKGEGQLIGSPYRPPAHSSRIVEGTQISRDSFHTISSAVDAHYRQIESDKEFQVRAAKLLAGVNKEIARQRKLKANLEKDLISHGSPEEHKRLGDLLLSNVSSAKRDGNKVQLVDYYAEGTPTIELEVDANTSLPEAAGTAFGRYAKSKRAIEEIATRLHEVERKFEQLEAKKLRLQEAIEIGDESGLAEWESTKAKKPGSTRKQEKSAGLPGMRRYVSSDGYEVILGRTARDNDRLTFREARPNDLWLHAGDYPGSHVIVRNNTRKEIPHRTIVEAAQLAAKFSQAGKDSKVKIHYTQRKFLSKPKGAAPGLVRLSSFKSITVEPGENIERM